MPCLFLKFSTTARLEMLTKRRQTPRAAPPRSTVETQQDTGTVCFADVSHFQPANVYFFGCCWPKSSDLLSFLLFFFWSEPLHTVAPTKFLYLFNMQWHGISSWIKSAGYLFALMIEYPVFVWEWSKFDVIKTRIRLTAWMLKSMQKQSAFVYFCTRSHHLNHIYCYYVALLIF